jgi:glycosyltransferase involved in cell wall biosynthesis
MKITFLCQYFPPEMGAPSARTYEHARHWASLGHDVTVITGFPNHPTGIIRPEYRGSFVKREMVDGIQVLRTWIYCAANKGFAKRVLNFLSFFVSSWLLGAFMTRRPDVVVGTSPQFFCAVAGYLLSCIKRVPFVFEVRDIWPQSAVELGALRNPWLIRLLEAIEIFLYRRAALIVIVADSSRPYLLAKGIASEKIKMIPNGIDAQYLALTSESPDVLREELEVQGKFVVSYIGTHGMSHALDTVLRAAKALEAESDVHFLLVGEGAEKDNLKKLAADLQLRNVAFMKEQPRDRLLAFYRASDVSLVPLRRLPIFKKVLPSKIFELMGVGCPIICSVEGEAAELIQRAQAGLCIEPENVAALVAAIHQLRNESALGRTFSENGERFVKTNYLRSVLAEKYLLALSGILPPQVLDNREAALEERILTEPVAPQNKAPY